jgi:hypothetical protein
MAILKCFFLVFFWIGGLYTSGGLKDAGVLKLAPSANTLTPSESFLLAVVYALGGVRSPCTGQTQV